MSKAKKHRKVASQPMQGGFNHFVNEMYEALVDFDDAENIEEFCKSSVDFKRQIYNRYIHINNPQAGNEYITPGERKAITVKIKKYYREKNIKIETTSLSNYQLHLLISYLYVVCNEIERKTGIKDHDDALAFRKSANSLLDVFYSRFVVDCCRIVTQMSNPAKKYYSIDVRPAALFKKNPSINIVIEIFGTPLRKSMVNISGNWRPVYQMGKISFRNCAEWITVPSTLLKDHYPGCKDSLEVFIQSHALNRLKERLDNLDEEALNYALWENTFDIKGFKNYKGYLLLPFNLFEIRIGYLVANVLGDKIVFRTFLFITHSCTPEGDRLKKITGLGNEDISYWQIDRMSTFLEIDMQKYPELKQIFEEAGLGKLIQLKDKTFNIDTLQNGKLDGLIEYIRQGRKEVLEPV